MNKKLAVLIALAILLASCASPAGPTPTALPTNTSTPVPSATLVPTVTPTPTATPDPNRPPDATGRDLSTGEYTKTADLNGRSITYVWKNIQFGADAANGIQGHWFESRMAKGPINLTCCEENVFGPFILNLNLYYLEGLRDLDHIGYLVHPDAPSDFATHGHGYASLPSSIMFDMFVKYLGLSNGEGGSSSHDLYFKTYGLPSQDRAVNARVGEDLGKYLRAINSGATIRVGAADWVPGKGYDVYWIDENAAKADPQMYFSNGLYSKVFVSEWKLVTVLAASASFSGLQSAKPETQKRAFRTAVLFPLAAVLNAPDSEPPDLGWMKYQSYGGAAGPGQVIVSKSGRDPITTSFIDFVAGP